MAKPQQKQQSKSECKITPLMAIEGVPHALEFMDIPEYQAVSVIKIEGTTNYAHVILTIKNGKVTEILAGEPNMWQVAVDLAKIDFVKTFMRPESF